MPMLKTLTTTFAPPHLRAQAGPTHCMDGDMPVLPQRTEREVSSASTNRSLRSRHGPAASAAALPMVPKDPDALLEGWLKKRGTRIPGHWSERYFVLKEDRLMYYLKPSDSVARGTYVLDRTCVVSEVKPFSMSYDKKKALHAFRIVWPEAAEIMEAPPVAAVGAGESSTTKSSNTSTATTSRKDGESKRHSARFAGPLPAYSGSNETLSSSRTNATCNADPEGSQVVGVSMDPYVMSSYRDPAHQQKQQQAITRIVYSVCCLSEGRSNVRRLGSQGSTSFSGGGGSQRGEGSSGSSSSSGPVTFASSGAMVAMAVGGVVVGAMTAGLGLVAPMVIVGLTAATGSGAAVYGAASSSSHGGLKTKQVALVLALDSKESAEEWRTTIEARIRMSQRFPQLRWMSMVGLDRRKPHSLSMGTTSSRSSSCKQRSVPCITKRLENVDRWTRVTRWRPWGVDNGIRVYELDHVTIQTGVVQRWPTSVSTAASEGGCSIYSENGIRTWGRATKAPLPCRKVQVTVRGTPLETFIALISVPYRILNGVVESVRNLERLDDQSDVIHLTFKPLFLWPTRTAPRDFCLLRSWRYDEDGTYIICYDSTTHRACPPLPGYVRGAMHAVYTISPRRHSRGGGGAVELNEAPECLLTHILQVDPKGWVWHQLGYLDAFVTEMLCQVLDVRDLLETDRFMAVHVDTSEEGGMGGEQGARGKGKGNELGKGEHTEEGASGVESSGNAERGIGTLVMHQATVPAEMWGDVDATSFVVRGPNYSVSKLKVPSEPAAFHLLAVDLFDLPEAHENIAGHVNNRVQVAVAAGDCPPFVFVVQLQIPGVDQQLGYVTYFSPPDMALLEEDTPLSRVLKPFFFGSDDGYRDLRFKLIPKIVEGNWVVRKSVGSTPAILGTKLKQTYHRGTNYFELDINIASSSVAAGVVRLAAGYAKTLVIDLALVVQGETEDELPERVVAGWRINNMDLATAKRLE